MANRSHSGGGRTETKQNVRTGNAAQGINPQHAAQIGRSMTVKDPMKAPMPAGGNVKLGNEVALNVGRGGPGAGRMVHARGTQNTWGPVEQGQSPASRGQLTVGRKP